MREEISDFRMKQERILSHVESHTQELKEIKYSIGKVSENQLSEIAQQKEITASLKISSEVADKLLGLIKHMFFYALLPLAIMVFVLALLFAGVKFTEISSFGKEVVKSQLPLGGEVSP